MNNKDNTFARAVLDLVNMIPKGRITSYGAIARALGASRSSRMVGWILSQANKGVYRVPAHRVVNRNGLLTGRHHFSPPEKMQKLLESEGVIVKDDKVIDFDKLFWNPLEEI